MRSALSSLAVAVLLATVLIQSAGAATPPECVRVMYDKFNDATTVQLKPQYVYKNDGFMAVNFEARLSFFFVTAGDSSKAPDSLTFLVIHPATVRKSISGIETLWWFSDASDHGLVVLVDDQRRDLGKMTYVRGPAAAAFARTNGLIDADKWLAPEILHINLSTRTVIELLRAKASAGRVDGMDFFFQNKRQNNLKNYLEFADFLESLTTPHAQE